MDTSTNHGLPRTNVRLVLLAAAALLFGLLWSSDQDYQTREFTAVRERQELTADQPLVAAVSPVTREENSGAAPVAPIAPAVPAVRHENAASVRVAPFAASSWIAPSFSTSAAEEAVREPLVAPRVQTKPPATHVSNEPIVSVMVVFRRQSFRVDDTGIVDTTGQAERASGWPLFEADYRAVARCIDFVQSEVLGRTCDMRWQFRCVASSAGRKMMAFVRRQIGPEMDWRILVERFARGDFGPFDPADGNAAAKHAAAPGPADER
jgi:hypothetical protein